MDFKNKSILVTGGAGFLGSYVLDKLQAQGCKRVFAPRKKDFDLCQTADVARLLSQERFDVVIHLAASVGGIGINQKLPGTFFYENAIMGLQLMEESRKRGVGKFVAVGTICAYPKMTPVPFCETELWNGYPEETNAPYGLAKKMMLVQAQAYRAQYGFNAVYLLPVNLYGPRDNFDFETSHVIPALIRRCLEAKEKGDSEIEVWGDGSPTREFLYVEDAAEGVLLAAQRYDGAEPVNLGSGQEISIRDLANLVVELTDYKGKLVWASDKPNGQPRRCLDTSRAKEWFGFSAKENFREGLKKTIDWYQNFRRKNRVNPVPALEAAA